MVEISLIQTKLIWRQTFIRSTFKLQVSLDSALTNSAPFSSRAGYLDEDQMQVLLERAQTEVFSIKQKLDNDLKQEKKKLHQKLIIKRRREMLQKVYKELWHLFFA